MQICGTVNLEIMLLKLHTETSLSVLLSFIDL